MELPEGFKKFVAYKGSMVEASALLIEMAEALESIIKQNGHIRVKDYKTLEKFKEWK